MVDAYAGKIPVRADLAHGGFGEVDDALFVEGAAVIEAANDGAAIFRDDKEIVAEFAKVKGAGEEVILHGFARGSNATAAGDGVVGGNAFRYGGNGLLRNQHQGQYFEHGCTFLLNGAARVTCWRGVLVSTDLRI